MADNDAFTGGTPIPRGAASTWPMSAPSGSDMMDYVRQFQADNFLRMQANMARPDAQYAASRIMRGLYGDQASSPAHADAFKNILGATGIAMNMYGIGGSSWSVAAGAQGIAASGLSFNGSQLPAGSQASDIFASELLTRVLKPGGEFYTATGGAKLDRTMGLDMTQMGQMMSLLGARGAFRGMDAGKMVTDPTTGQQVAKFNDDSVEKIQKVMEDSAGVFRRMTNLFGSRSYQELAYEAEKLSGLSFGDLGGPKKIGMILQSIETQSRAMGISEKSVAEMQAQGADYAGQLGFGTRAGGAASNWAREQSLNAYDAKKAAQGIAAQSGVWVNAPTMQEMQAQMLKNFAGTLDINDTETMTRMAAIDLSKQMGIVNPGLSEKLKSLAGQGTSDATQKMQDILAKTSYGDAASYVMARGGPQVLNESLDWDSQNLLAKSSQALVNERTRSIGSQVEAGRLGLLDPNDPNDSRMKGRMLGYYVANMDSSSQTALALALQNGKLDEALGVVDNSSGMTDTQSGHFKDVITNYYGSEGKKLGVDLMMLHNKFQSGYGAAPTVGDTLLGKLKGLRNMETDSAPGMSGSPLTQIMAGIFGASTMGTPDYMNMARQLSPDKITSFDMAALTQADVTRAGKALGLNVSGIDINTKKGYAAFESLLADAHDSGQIVGTMSGGINAQGVNNKTYSFVTADTMQNLKGMIDSHADIINMTKAFMGAGAALDPTTLGGRIDLPTSKLSQLGLQTRDRLAAIMGRNETADQMKSWDEGTNKGLQEFFKGGDAYDFIKRISSPEGYNEKKEFQDVSWSGEAVQDQMAYWAKQLDDGNRTKDTKLIAKSQEMLADLGGMGKDGLVGTLRLMVDNQFYIDLQSKLNDVNRTTNATNTASAPASKK